MSDNNGIDLEFIIQRQDTNHRDILEKLDKIVDKQSEHGETLVRNTISLEEHIRRTNLLETDLKDTKEDVEDIKEHVDKIKFVMKVMTPTKSKLKWLAALLAASGLTTGGIDLASKDSFIIKAIEEYSKSK